MDALVNEEIHPIFEYRTDPSQSLNPSCVFLVLYIVYFCSPFYLFLFYVFNYVF
jgi:hypothetical protein